MDLQLRQVMHHIEHEFEWESCFRLHIYCMPVFAQIIKWCATDRIVYIKTMRMLFKKLFEDMSANGQESSNVTILDSTAECIDYKILAKPVALHHPLTRLLAGLSLHLNKFDLTFEANEFDIMERPSSIQMMEPSLRTTVFIGQIQAGLWRRNGHSLNEQAMAYNDPRWRKELKEQDITMLQLAAAMMKPDDFMINVINKYDLLKWTLESFDCKEDDSVRQINTLVEEFLSTMIYILGERYAVWFCPQHW